MRQDSPQGANGKADGRRVPARRTFKVSESLARDILYDIRDLPPATKLPAEAAMVEKYGVGRASIREALRILEVQGLIQIRPGPGGGPMVAPRSSRHFAGTASMHLFVAGATYRDVMTTRLTLEPLMARLAASRPDHAELFELEDLAATPDEDTDTVEFVGAARDFHEMIASFSTNPVLNLLGVSMQDIYHHGLVDRVFPDDQRAKVEEDHRQIAKAILKGSATRAERLMREHMEEFVHFAEDKSPGALDEIVSWHY